MKLSGFSSCLVFVELAFHLKSVLIIMLVEISNHDVASTLSESFLFFFAGLWLSAHQIAEFFVFIFSHFLWNILTPLTWICYFFFLSYSDFFHILKYQMTAVVKEHYNKYSWKRYFDFNLVKFCLFICIIIWLDSQKKYSLILINTFFSTHKNVSILVKDILCFLSNDDFSQRKIEIDSC